MDSKSDYTFSNKLCSSMDYYLIEQKSKQLNNGNINNSINNDNKSNINGSGNNNRGISELFFKLEKNEQANGEQNKCDNLLQFKEEFAKIKNIINNDPLRNPNLKTQDCFELYGYPFISQSDSYNFPQFNNMFKQKYLVKTLFDNKYIYINGKQYHRIMKRREVRRKLNENMQINLNQNRYDKNKKYHHESRHKHAMNRERGKGGRFLSKKEKQEKKNNDEISMEDEK